METVNDKDALITNFWRATQADPELTAEWADQPVHEADLHARHAWLLQQLDDLAERIAGDPHFYDPKVAGWWVWGMSVWIGGGFCSGIGPWRAVDGILVKGDGPGAWRSMPFLSGPGQGVKRQLPRLNDNGAGVERKRPHLMSEKGVHAVGRNRPHLGRPAGVTTRSGQTRPRPAMGTEGSHGCGILRSEARSDLVGYFEALADRLRHARVCSGDWERICGPSVTYYHGMTGVFLDPPYSGEAGRDQRCYREESTTVAHDVRAWCLANGANPLLRIALCGYAGEGHEELLRHGWSEVAWKASGGYGSTNGHRERIWFSPACVRQQQQQMGLFE